MTSEGEKLVKKIRSRERKTVKNIPNDLPANKIQSSIEVISYMSDSSSDSS